MTVNDEIKRMAEIIKDTVPADRIYLFGSFAYGAPTNGSDYDFYVVLPDDSMKPSEAMRNIYRALHKLRDRRSVDIMALPKTRFDDRKKLMTLEKKVAEEGVLLYG
jgi:predicted nucleotidyltransferase